MAEQVNAAQAEEKVDYEAVAKSVLRVGQSMKRLRQAGLNKRAVCLLIRDLTNIGMADIERAMWAAEILPSKFLEADFIKKHTQPSKK
jgi:hypothetical protein